RMPARPIEENRSVQIALTALQPSGARTPHHRGEGFNPRHGAQAVNEPVVIQPALDAPGESLRFQIEYKKLISFHAEIDAFVVEERTNGEPSGYEEDKAHGDLEGDDEIPNTRVMAVRACRLTGGPEGLVGTDLQGLREGGERKCDGDQRRNSEGEP